MTKQNSIEKEYMRLLYNGEHKPLLYGHVAFYKQSHPNQREFANSTKSSKPFVIGRFKPGSDVLVVYGSVHFLIKRDSAADR